MEQNVLAIQLWLFYACVWCSEGETCSGGLKSDEDISIRQRHVHNANRPYWHDTDLTL